MTDIIVPADLWDDGQAAVMGTWMFSDGEAVAAGSVIAEVMRDKTSYEIIAPASGTLRHGAAEDDEIELGASIGTID